MRRSGRSPSASTRAGAARTSYPSRRKAWECAVDGDNNSTLNLAMRIVTIVSSGYSAPRGAGQLDDATHWRRQQTVSSRRCLLHKRTTRRGYETGTSARARAVTRGHCRHTMNGRFAGQTCSRMPGRVRAYRLRTSMVRRGSTVRVRQRALQKPRKSRLFLSSELARTPICGTHGAVYGAFRSRTPARCRRKRALLASNEQTSVQPQARGVPEDVEMHFPLVRVRRAPLQPV